jgi:hypothetical protein
MHTNIFPNNEISMAVNDEMTNTYETLDNANASWGALIYTKPNFSILSALDRSHGMKSNID